MKQRFSSLDVRVLAAELNAALTTLRIANIYDLSSRIFLFKIAKPGRREQLLVDSGFRCHLTAFSRTAASAPSPFITRLRKYLKSKRITGIRQIGTDRVIEITISDGQYRLYLEFFAAGNIVLTDAELNVLALLRQVSEGDEDVDVKLGGKYTLEAKQNFKGISSLTQERVKDVLHQAQQKAQAAVDIGGKKAKRAKGADDLRKALSSGFPEYPAHLLEHVFKINGLDAALKVDAVLGNEDLMVKVMSSLELANQIFNTLGEGQSKGYIIAKIKDGYISEAQNGNMDDPARDALLYDDFHPFRPAQFENKPGVHILEFEGFNKTVDEFYSSIESQKLESRLTEREEAAKRKLESAKNEHEKRLGALQHIQELHIRKAQAIEANTHRVEEACAAVNGLIGQGMDWVDIGKLIENEQTRGNVVAQMIKLPLKLEENTVTLLLDEPGAEESEEEEEDETDEENDSEDENANKAKPLISGDKRLVIDIDLGITPWANARQYYEQKKSASVKEQKTIMASERALKSTEKKIEADLKKGLKQEKTALRPARKQFWFEKFLFFISSEGYLVIGGKDVQQNELLYRRYLKKGDIYVHADLPGAASVIVKNNPLTPDAPIPPSTLSQAGTLTVCTSNAWESKAVMAAWWVEADQVSKTTPNGEYLQTGGFVIRGKKNFLPPSQLILGFGIAWLITEASRANHGKHRMPGIENNTNETEALTDSTQNVSLEDEDDEDETDGDNGVDIEGQAVPDVEEAAEEAQIEVDEDKNAANSHGQEDVDDKASNASDEERNAPNPLQTNGVKTAVSDDKNDEGDVNVEGENETNEDQEDDDDDEGDEMTSLPASGIVTPSADTQSVNSTQRQKQVARGKRGKAKKAAKKYAEQDEEDRILAMQLLGSNKAQEQKVAAAEEKAAREAKAAADKERRRAQHARAAEAERNRQARLADSSSTANPPNEDDSYSAAQAAEELSELKSINRIVPAVQPGDVLLAAIPIVAPWPALARTKYKVKLQPGGVKKGKAVREIVGSWNNIGTSKNGAKFIDATNSLKDRVWARELELIKEWRVEEIVGSVPVKGVRIVQGGGLAGGGSGLGGSGSGGKGKSGGNAARGGKGGKKAR